MYIEIGYEIKDGKLYAWSHIPKKELNMTDLEESAYNKNKYKKGGFFL